MAPETEVPHRQTHRVFACQRCSQRKQKCDRILPVCSNCRSSDSSCITSDREKDVVQLNDKEVARKGYVTNLLERIASLESQMPGLTTSSTMGDATATIVPSTSPSSSDSERAAPLTHPRWPLDGTSMNMDSLSRSAMAEPRGRAGEFLKQLSMPRIIAGVTETYGGNPEAATRVDSLWDGISKYIRHPVGPTHRLFVQSADTDKALETYLEVVDFRFPRLPVEKVKAGFSAIASSDESLYTETMAKDPAHIFMAYMVIAIVPLVSDNYPISQGSFVSIQLLGKCLRVLDRVFRQDDGVDIIQCLHLLVVFSIHCSAAGSAWHLIGFAMNKCIALGYHRDPIRTGLEVSVEELEQRRWSFWGCYHLDRLICAALGRPCSIDDRYITVTLPREPNPSDWRANLQDAFNIHLFRYAQLLSSMIGEEVEEDFDVSLGRMLQWRSTMPLHSEPNTRHPYLYQTSLYNTCMLRVGIREILKPYNFVEEVTQTTKVTHSAVIQDNNFMKAKVEKLECPRVQNMKLLDICCSVARSLDRNRMVGRHFLSFLTGYSAFSMALATLYHRALFKRSMDSTQSQFNTPQSVFEDSYQRLLPSIQLPSQIFGPTVSCDIDYPSSWDAVVAIACQKLDIVGRQFPRMHEYKQIIERIRRKQDGIDQNRETQYPSSLERLVVEIRPLHLNRLAHVICFLMQ